jgi:hypothetical protein
MIETHGFDEAKVLWRKRLEMHGAMSKEIQQE